MWGSQTGTRSGSGSGRGSGSGDGAGGCSGNIRRGQPRPGVVRRAVPDQVRSTLRTEGYFSSGMMGVDGGGGNDVTRSRSLVIGRKVEMRLERVSRGQALVDCICRVKKSRLY